MPRPPGNQPQLQDPASSEGQNDDRPENHGEEQRYRQGQLTMQGQEVQLDALLVLQDEDKNHK
jgi:hypothetical protein